MPASKHRRKPNGKSVKHPGRNAARRSDRGLISPFDRRNAAWKRFADRYSHVFFRKWGHATKAGYMVDLIEEMLCKVDDAGTVTFITGEAEPLIRMFMDPIDGEEAYTAEDADEAIALLVKEDMIVMDGSRISIHPRFAEDPVAYSLTMA